MKDSKKKKSETNHMLVELSNSEVRRKVRLPMRWYSAPHVVSQEIPDLTERNTLEAEVDRNWTGYPRSNNTFPNQEHNIGINPMTCLKTEQWTENH
jgi:hypothetical protein